MDSISKENGKTHKPQGSAGSLGGDFTELLMRRVNHRVECSNNDGRARLIKTN
jgi:hypothetical protein